MRILLVEDNRKLAGYIKKALKKESYAVDCVFDGGAGEERAVLGEYDLVILDIMLPVKDGFQVCRALRGKNVNIPILLLTARGELEDRVEGLDSGADDYLVKPFELKELSARLRALLRRPPKKKNEILTAGSISLDNARHIARMGDEILSLTLKEYAVLDFLVRNKDLILSRAQIYSHCWELADSSYSNVVDAVIKQLRKKLNDNKKQNIIKTIRGVGY
ncbi:MAG: response regulator transcription factor, partial [Thermoleophilia bacterium]